MLTYTLRRVAMAVPVVVVAVLASFVLLTVLPGDPVRAVLGPYVPAQVVETRRAELGLDKPLLTQLWSFLRGMVRGDLGVSAVHGESVTTVLTGTIGPTFVLVLMGIGLGVFSGVALGTAAAWRRGHATDHSVRVLTIIGAALPSFWVGLVLLELFAVRWEVFPAGAYGDAGVLRALLLPAITMGVLLGSLLARVVRSRVLTALDEEYVRAACARGVRRRRVVLAYVGRDVWPSVIAFVGASLGGLLGLCVVLEIVFAVPGMGATLFDAVRTRDFPVVRGICVVLAVVVVLGNVAADVLRAALDPRLRA